ITAGRVELPNDTAVGSLDLEAVHLIGRNTRHRRGPVIATPHQILTEDRVGDLPVRAILHVNRKLHGMRSPNSKEATRGSKPRADAFVHVHSACLGQSGLLLPTGRIGCDAVIMRDPISFRGRAQAAAPISIRDSVESPSIWLRSRPIVNQDGCKSVL